MDGCGWGVQQIRLAVCDGVSGRREIHEQADGVEGELIAVEFGQQARSGSATAGAASFAGCAVATSKI